ncbi:hypothetical protein M0R45_008229 [Rubus argutus]|uniref:Uncharacterized protein n=1 Tax=Rubus argutus TaxID=59490 RepID=A0AAW1Y154_RUBAR
MKEVITEPSIVMQCHKLAEACRSRVLALPWVL